ncbi:MAG: dephospho-CoA kinase [Mogibacterium sp.]|nr:dephospho-CoA kinase [Mogibacterium sp.]MBR2541065.1 dephospho-CoA kinase [Mogibacterium sp.]
MISIAVTGGIGSGKSTVTDYLQEKGFTVIDADKMAREITSAGGKAMPYILKNFGPDYINPDGSLNRAAMRDLVFKRPAYKEILEAGTTAVVIEDIEQIRREKAASGEKALFFDIPLLFEAHQENNYDQVWVVTADRDIRAERIMKRDGIDPSIIDLIMDTQTEEDHKISKADVVIYNNGTIEALKNTVDELLADNVLI